MNTQTYSRDFLKSMPEQRKKQQIDTIVQGFIHDIQTAAALGITSYRYVREDSALTDAEIVAGFFERFPGCKVYYENIITETSKLKRSIVIDWS
jgi:hypothetical protein